MKKLNLPLLTRRLKLRQPKLADAEAIFNKYAQDKEVTKYLVWQPHQNLTETKKFLADCLQKIKSYKEYDLVVERKSDQEILGMLAIRFKKDAVELGYVLAKKYWRQGYMSELVKTISDDLLTKKLTNKIRIICDNENVGSAEVAKKAGFIFKEKKAMSAKLPNLPKGRREELIFEKS